MSERQRSQNKRQPLRKDKEAKRKRREAKRKQGRRGRGERARGAAPGVTLLSYQSAIGIGWSVERGTSRRREAERSGRRPLRRYGGYNILRSNRQAIGVWRDETEGGKANRRREGGEEGVSVEFVWPTCLAESCISVQGRLLSTRQNNVVDSHEDDNLAEKKPIDWHSDCIGGTAKSGSRRYLFDE